MTVLSKRMFLWVIFGFVVLFCLGHLRDLVFVNLNDQLFKLYYKNSFFMLPNWLRWLESFSYMQLYRFKFVLSILFVAAFYLATVFSLLVYFGKKSSAFRYTTLVYLAVLAFAALIYGLYLLAGNYKPLFVFSRTLLSILSSPVPFMFLFPALLFLTQSIRFHPSDTPNE